jgi:hypothetical protein
MILHSQSVDLVGLRQIIAGLSECAILVGAKGALLWAHDAAPRMLSVEDIEALGGNVARYGRRFRLRYRNSHILGKKDYPLGRTAPFSPSAYLAPILEL